MELAFPSNTESDSRLPTIKAAPTEERVRLASGLSQFHDAGRAQSSLLAPLEKKCLLWMARRMPEWISSDHLTLLSFLAMALAGLSFWLARSNPVGFLLVFFWLAVNWFGDSMDGTIARVRNRQRPRYGFYVDHMVDTFGALFLLGGMMLSGQMNPGVAAALLIVYFMLAIEIYLATYTLGTFHLSTWKIGPTELRIIIATGSIALFRGSSAAIMGRHFCLFDVGGVVAIAGIFVTLVLAVVRHACLLYSAEPIDTEPTPGKLKRLKRETP